MKIKKAAKSLVKTVLPMVGGLAVLILVIAVLAGVFTEKIPPGERAVTASSPEGPDAGTYVVQPIQKPHVEELIGTLKAASRTEISSRVQATIKRIAVRAGDAVEEGDVLVELDQEAIERQVAQAEEGLAAAEAGLAQADDVHQRAVRLKEAEIPAITQEQFNKAVNDLEQARRKRNQAAQALAETKVLLSYATIKAPQAGLVVDRLAEEGDLARPGFPLLALYDPTSLRLEAPVVEELAVKLTLGEKLEVYIDSLDRVFQASVDEIVPQAVATSRSLLVKVKLPPSPDLYEGMFGRLRIPTGIRRHLCLHRGAIQRIGQLEFVEVIAADGRSRQRRFIKTGQFGDADHVEVLSGLDAGETVVLRNVKASAVDTSPESGRDKEAPAK
jgi:RND family efflux transporter MFP subunit